MAKKINIDGKRFGRMVALWHSYTIRKKYGKKATYKDYYECVCDCGTRKASCKHDLLIGDANSCGCLGVEARLAASKKHGASRSDIYGTWGNIIERCTNPKNPGFKNYGGRGITICERWRSSFESFRDDMGPKPTPKHTVERRDNNKGYSPENCSWETMLVQMRNNRRNVYFEIGGEKKTMQAWCDQFGIRRYVAYQRYKKLGWTIEEALGLVPYKKWSGAEHKLD
jgi:hypothetical protein